MSGWITGQPDSDNEEFSINKDSQDSEDLNDPEEFNDPDLEDPCALEELNEGSENDEDEDEDDEDETNRLSFEEKAKHLQETFKSIPPLMIKKVLQRDDVKGSVHAANSCLRAMSSNTGLHVNRSGSLESRRRNRPKATQNFYEKNPQEKNDFETNEKHGNGAANQGIERKREVATMAENASESRMKDEEFDDHSFGLMDDELEIEDIENDDADSLTLEEKVKILQDNFKGFPPFVIRKVLGRQDVNENLEAASNCLKDMSPLKGPFKKDGGCGREEALKGQKNLGRRKGWTEQDKEKGQGNQVKDISEKTKKEDEETSKYTESGDVGAAGRTDSKPEDNKQNKKRNRNRNRNRNKNTRSQNQRGNEGERLGPPSDGFFPHNSWQGGFPQQWGPDGFNPVGFIPSGYSRVGGMASRGYRCHSQRGHQRGNQRGFSRGGNQRHQGNYYYGDPSFPNQFPCIDDQRGDFAYYQGDYSQQNIGSFHGQHRRSQSEADLRNRGPQQRGNRGQACSRGKEENSANASNRRGRGQASHRWIGRGSGRGTRQRQPSEAQNLPTLEETQSFEPNIILLRGLNTATTFDAIRNYIEARTNEEVLDIAKVDQENALVTLEKLSDFETAKQKVEGRTLDGTVVNIQRVPVSSSILVSNLSSNTTNDALEYYFSAPRVGGDVTSIQYENGNSTAVVTFKDPKVLNKVLSSKSHKLNDAKLTVEVYYPTFQNPSQQQHTRDEIPVGVDKDVMEFISTTNSLNELEELLSDQGFMLKDTSEDSVLYIAPKKGKQNSANKEAGKKVVYDFVKKFKFIELDVEENHWDAVISEISQLHQEIGKNKLNIIKSFSKDKVTIICRVSDLKDLKNKFSQKIAATQNFEVKKTYHTQTMEIEEEKLALLNKIGFKEKHLSEHKELEVDIDQENGTIKIVGPKKQYSDAKIKIYQTLAKMSERKISFSQTVFEMLLAEEGLEKIKTKLREKQIDAVFCIDEDSGDNTASVVGISKTQADEAAELIKGLFMEIKVKVEKDIMEVLRTEKWSNICEEIKKDFKVFVRKNDYFDTWIAGFRGDVLKANDRIQKFLDDNSIGTETFCCVHKGARRYILEHRKDELVAMENTLKQYSVKITVGESSDAFLISGTKIGIARVQKALDVLMGSVNVNELKVEQPGLTKYFSSGRGDRLVKSLENEHRCVIEKTENVSPSSKSVPSIDLQGSHESLEISSSDESDEDDGATAQAYTSTGYSHSSVSSNATSSMTCGNVRISWKHGNIVTERVDILVGSTIGQLSKVFQAAGGSQIQQALGIKIHRGGVYVSQPGNLPCNHVILTCCCKWDGGNGAAEMELRSIVQQCLQHALQLNATSIAFPIIGTGGFGFPNNNACQIMISEVINVTSGWVTSSLNDIRFVVFAQDAQLINAFQQEFTSASGQARSGSFLNRLTSRLWDSLLTTPSSPTTTVNTFGNVSVQVLQGNLVHEQTDAIININSTDMDMQNAGALSKAVAAAAGPAVQSECSMLGQQTSGSAVVTGAGNLNVQHIIHMIPGNADVQHIQSCIEKCLQVADSYGFQSLSMPAFGTGSYNMPDADSAQATFQALANVCPNLQNLSQVRIVIFQAQMISTFHQTHQQYLAGTYKPSKIRKPQRGSNRSTPSTARKVSKSGNVDESVKTIEFRLFGKSKDSVDRAQTALTKGLTETCKTQIVENKDVSKLSERQRTKLTTKAKHLDVTIKFEDRIQRIVVRGDPGDVSAIINDIWEEIQERSKKENENEQAKVLYKTIKWQYELHGVTGFFNKNSNAIIEKAHAKKESRVKVEVEDEKYLIDFAKSTGTGLTTGQTISVMRTTVGSAAGIGGIALPKEWCPMPMDGYGKETTVHLVSLMNGSAEYQKVHNLFQSTGGRGQMVKIERIQNPHLYQQYMVRKAKMDKDNRGINNEQQLFHGTAEKNLNEINTTGFNRSFCGANGTAYGNGVYFAKNASYSMGYAKPSSYHSNKHMYLARVLTGESTSGHSGLIVPPKNPNKPNASFDSVTGQGGGIYVVFYDAQCYPEYLFTFQ